MTRQDLAGKLIEAHSQSVDWSEYRDDRTEQFATLVQAAIEKRPLLPVPAAPMSSLPLLEALQKSVAALGTCSLKRANGTVHPRSRSKRAVTRRMP